MPYIIDGNNLLGLAPDMLLKNPGARTRLVQQLAAFARARRTRVVVVFDGEPEPGISRPEVSLGDVRIVFAGRKTDADSRILRILDEAQDPAGFILVTSDRALGDRARSRRARNVTSLRFRRTLAAVPSSNAQRDGESSLTQEEVADWEAWFDRQGG